MRLTALIVLVGFVAVPAASQSRPQAEEEIVVTGIPNGASVVEVDFDKVWKRCAECKRALAKLDRLAAAYRSERQIAYVMGSGGSAGGQSGGTEPSYVGSWRRSSAEPVENYALGPRAFHTTPQGLAIARRQETGRRTTQEMLNRYASPEMATLQGHMRAFLDQLVPHVVEAAEAERIARGARASMVGKKGAKLAAKKVTRIDVTDAVIRRLDAKQFTITLPDPPQRKGKRK